MKNFSVSLPDNISTSVNVFADNINKLVDALIEIRANIPSTAADIAAVSQDQYTAALNRITALEAAISKLENPTTAVSVPDAPTITSVVAGDTIATVNFTAPANNGGAAITKYTVTSSTGKIVEGPSSPITVTGLTNGTPVTFTIKAVNSAGSSNSSAISASVTPISVGKPGAPTAVKISVGDAQATISWGVPASDGGSVITGYRVGRDKTDNTGYPEWSTDLAASARSQLFTALNNGMPYNITVAAINANGVGPAVTLQATPASSSTLPTAGTTPGTNPNNYKAFGLGAAVTGAANGNFNTWLGHKHVAYATWAQDGYYDENNAGKPWAVINGPDGEYGSNAVTRLGDFDLDIASQFAPRSWSGAANGEMDTFIRSHFTDIKNGWGTRQGHVFIRPHHEFNGTWYDWSVRNTADQANFVSYWRNHLRPAFASVFGSDKRFHLGWSPNRDSSYNLNVKNAFPGAAYVDYIGVDYYDFAKPTTDAQWTAEANATQNGDSPVGILKWLEFAAQQGVAVTLPEWGQQFGDNPLFINKMAAVFDAYRYTGTGSPAGKILHATWHNLQGSTPDPNAGGDFFIQSNAKDYSGRPNASKALRLWANPNTNLRWL